MVLFDPQSLSCMEAANTGLKRFQNGIILKQDLHRSCDAPEN
jgi:hypothetical protein